MPNINGRARLKWAVSKIYKMTKMTEMTIMTGNPFHCTATLKLAPDLEPIDYDPWAELEFKSKLTGLKMEEKQIITKLSKTFEEYAYEEDGIEFWFARDLQALIGQCLMLGELDILGLWMALYRIGHVRQDK